MPISKIRFNLFISACKDITKESISKLGITDILNVANDVQTPLFHNCDVKLHRPYTFSDKPADAKKHAPGAAKYAKELIDKGSILLIHCQAGKSRSPHVAALVLSEIENIDYDKAYERILVARQSVMKYSMGKAILDLDSNWLDRAFGRDK